MNTGTETRNYGFVLGMLTGAVVSTGLVMLFAPRTAREVRQRITDSATAFADRTSERYQQVGSRVDTAIGDLTRKGQGVRDGVADVVARGAHEVERFAMAAKSGSTSREL